MISKSNKKGQEKKETKRMWVGGYLEENDEIDLND
jgi:hypothetical protein